ncbi:MAG: hypothetical protein AAF483_27090 [Planctomycetota bacterium]
MLSNEMIYAGLVALLPKAATATWLAIILFRFADRRSSALSALICLAGSSLLIQQAASWQSPESEQFWAWQIASALSLLLFIVFLRTWSKISPRQLHEEQAAGKASTQSKPQKQQQRAERRGRTTVPYILPTPPELATLVLGLFVAIYCVSKDCQSLELLGRASQLALCSTLCNSLLWAVSIVTALQLNFLSSPDSLKPVQGPRVHWRVIAMVALAAFVCCLVASCAILLRKTGWQPEKNLASQVMPTGYGISWMVLGFIAWSVPNRVSRFQHSTKEPYEKASQETGWTSLTIAAWLCCFCFAILCVLPANWPWEFLH